MTTAVAVQKLNSVKDLLAKLQPQIAAALPKHMTPERMARIAFTAIQRQPLLLECTQQSLALAVINAGELGLEPNLLGEAYLVPYKDKQKQYQCQLIPGYKGLMKLARNSGLVKSFQVALVREGDFFEYEYGTNYHLVHKPKEDNADAPITHGWAGAIIDGKFEFTIMTKAELDKVKSTSKATSEYAPWAVHTDEMYKKTALRRFCKIQPASAEMARAVDLDERADAGLPQYNDMVDIGPVEEIDPNETGAGASISKKLEAKSSKPTEVVIPLSDSPEFKAAAEGFTDDQRDKFDVTYRDALGEGDAPDDAHAKAFKAATGIVD